MQVLVTGGAGFIGTHVCRRLLQEGHAVVVIDNESNGHRSSLPEGVRFILGDVALPAQLEPAFSPRPDVVLHIAGQVSILKSFANPADDLRTNVEGTLCVLQACVRHKVPRLVYASSMTIYGECQAVPTPETEPLKPNAYYGITKLAAERYVLATAERPDLGFDFHATALRMFSVYGPGQSFSNPYQGVLGIFAGNLLRGEPITVFGDGRQSRDFVFIDDIVEGWIKALRLERPGLAINLGSGRSVSIRQLAEHAVAAFGHAPGSYPIVHQPARPGEQRNVQADVSLAGAQLGWRPSTSLEQGLARTVAWARSEFASRGKEAGRP